MIPTRLFKLKIVSYAEYFRDFRTENSPSSSRYLDQGIYRSINAVCCTLLTIRIALN